MSVAANAFEWNVSAEEYHRDTSKIGHSMFETFVESQKDYCDFFVTGARPVPPPTKDMLIGIRGHVAVFEPEVWASKYCFDLPPREDGEPWNWRKKAHREERDALKGERPYLLEIGEREQIESIRDAVFANADAGVLMRAPGICEQAYHWQHETGLTLKTKPDKVIGDTTIVDLKTCPDASPAAFLKSCMAMGYHRTAAWRIDGHIAKTGRAPRHYFIAASKTNFEVGVYELGPSEIELGRKENRYWLNRLAECYASGDWEAEWSKQVMVLTYPAWRFKSDEWEID